MYTFEVELLVQEKNPIDNHTKTLQASLYRCMLFPQQKLKLICALLFTLIKLDCQMLKKRGLSFLTIIYQYFIFIHTTINANIKQSSVNIKQSSVNIKQSSVNMYAPVSELFPLNCRQRVFPPDLRDFFSQSSLIIIQNCVCVCRASISNGGKCDPM
jgi:hypothetical protein